MSWTVTVDSLALSPEAERVFAEYLDRRDEGAAEPFAELCDGYPLLAPELTRAWRDWTRVDELLQLSSGPEPPGGAPLTRVEIPSASPLAARLLRLAARRESFERYVLIERIGRGAMGEVHRVKDRDLRRLVALKRMRIGGATGKGRSLSWNRISRFLQEAQVLAQLSHQGIIPVFDLGVDVEGRPYITMPLVEGEDLRAVLLREARGDPMWTRRRILGIVLSVCEALAYAHARGVIHRDVKPANVLVGAYGQAVLTDWGLAKLLGAAPEPDSAPLETDRAEQLDEDSTTLLRTDEGSAPGTPAYMAPEQAAGIHARVGPPADVYAVGAILYQLLAHRVPYVEPGTEPSRAEVRRLVIAGPPEPLAAVAPEVPPELEAICERAMAREIERRYADTGELAADLRAYLEQGAVSAYQEGAWAQLCRWVQNNRALAASLSAALVIALVGLAAVAYVGRQGRAELRRQTDYGLLHELQAEADGLWPAGPEMVPRLADWLREAELLAARLGSHRRALAELQRAGRAREELGPEEDRAGHPLAALHADLTARCADLDQGLGALDPVARQAPRRRALLERRRTELTERLAAVETLMERRRLYAFDDVQDELRHDHLLRLVEGLEVFVHTDPQLGRLAEVSARLERARRIGRESLEECAEEWNEAIEAIADRERGPLYDGLVISPQVGLVPLGPDPRSGLWEFAELSSGEPPARDRGGRLAVTEASGLVFVLLPGGSFVQGAVRSQDASSGSARIEREARPNEGPPGRVDLAPFFFSKYEMTQAQWRRACEDEPSRYGPGHYDARGDHVVTALHPVEGLEWEQARAGLARLGLLLPTEAQWECAIRAGTGTPFYVGLESAELGGLANFEPPSGDGPDPDGYGLHAPIGSYPPNPWGLHDMAGNVWEWTRDSYWSHYGWQMLDAEGTRAVPDEGLRAIRGGSYSTEPATGRSSFRHDGCITYGVEMGVRPVRRLEGAL